MTILNANHFEERGKSKELFVVFHAYKSSPKKLESVCRVIKENFPNADLYIPSYSTGWGSTTNPNDIVNKLITELDKIWEDRTKRANDSVEYDKLVFVGHSLGALIARQVYVRACGINISSNDEEDSFKSQVKPWGLKIERIILFAGMNRGWRISHHLDIKNAILWSLGMFIGNLIKIVSGKTPLIFSIRRGASFITQLRIGWISMRNKVKENNIGDALTIQLLGSVDDMVSPDDNIDLVSGHDFVYLDVPQSGHANVIDMNDNSKGYSVSSSDRNSTVGELREEVFISALSKTKEELDKETVLPSDLPLQDKRENVTDVVFVIHGIRDKGFWTHKIARNIMKLAKMENMENTVISTETSSYGYFPMLPFLLPSRRREKVEWLMDQYAQSLSLCPNAEFSFVGHSNGTYLLAKSLEVYPFCKFKNVVFAGSVVSTKYDWERFLNKGQVKNVLNYVATADWVVALFPKAIQMLGIQDLGSAGHDGFNKNKSVKQITYVRGPHNAALNEANWESISKFILTGEVFEPPIEIRNEYQSKLVKILGKIAPLVWVILALLLGCVYYYCIFASNIGEFGKGVLSMLYIFLIWKVVTFL